MNSINTNIFVNIIKYLDLGDIQSLARSNKFLYHQFTRTQVYKSLNELSVSRPKFKNKLYQKLLLIAVVVDIVSIGIYLKCWHYVQTDSLRIAFLFGWLELRNHIKLTRNYDYGAIMLLSLWSPTMTLKISFILSYLCLKYMDYSLDKIPRFLRYAAILLLISYPSNFIWLLVGLSNRIIESLIDRYYPKLSYRRCVKRIINSVVRNDYISSMLIQKYELSLHSRDRNLINLYALDYDNPVGLMVNDIHKQIVQLICCDSIICYKYLRQHNTFPDLDDKLELYFNSMPTIWLDPKKICPNVFQCHQSQYNTV